MRRDQLEHIIRAAGSIIGEDRLIVIGSQAILASDFDDFPEVVVTSIEADVVPLDDDEGTKANLIDGTIGEGSLFEDSFGIYAQGVSEATARLAPGWHDRLIPLENENTGGVTGLCLEIHDLVAAKMLAGRPQDIRYCKALIDADLIETHIVLDRIANTDVVEPIRTRATEIVLSWQKSA